MLGFIHDNHKMLSDAEQEEYKAFNCGLCLELRSLVGVKGRMLLNCDMTFLIILLTGLYDLPLEEQRFLCPGHPGKKQLAYVNDATRYVARMNLLLEYHRLQDATKDGSNLSKRTLAKSYRKAYEAICAEYPEKVAAVEELLRKMQDAAARREENMDVVAGYMGSMLSEFFLWKRDERQKNLSDMGYYLGKFIYTMSAYANLEEDTKRAAYNPLRLKKNCNPECYEVFCRQALSSMVAECVKSFDCLQMVSYEEMLRKILYADAWKTE